MLNTALFMWRFFEFHLRDKFQPAAALRRAQLWLRDLTLVELEQHNATVRDNDPFLYTQLERTRNELLAQHGGDTSARPFAHPTIGQRLLLRAVKWLLIHLWPNQTNRTFHV